MKDSERARNYLGDLYKRYPGGHAYEPDSYKRADSSPIALADLMDLLAEVREDERNKRLTPVERLEQVFGPHDPAKPKTYIDNEGDYWRENSEDREKLHFLRGGVPDGAKFPRQKIERDFGPLKLVVD